MAGEHKSRQMQVNWKRGPINPVDQTWRSQSSDHQNNSAEPLIGMIQRSTIFYSRFSQAPHYTPKNVLKSMYIELNGIELMGTTGDDIISRGRGKM